MDIESSKKVFRGTKTTKTVNAPLFTRGSGDPVVGRDKYIVYSYYTGFCLKEFFPMGACGFHEMGRQLWYLPIYDMLKIVNAEGTIQTLLFQKNL